MPQYLSPGVYVEEVPSAIKAIAGVSTSTPGFIGIIPDRIPLPLSSVTNEAIGTGDGTKTVFNLDQYPVQVDAGTFEIRVDGTPVTTATLANKDANQVSQVTFSSAPASGALITGDYIPLFSPVAAGEVKLCTNFSQFKNFFGDFSTDPEQRNLVHAVYGFFNNGGSRCYVVRLKNDNGLDNALNAFAAIDEIALVAMPGVTDDALRDKLVSHCQSTGDRFAILDGPPVSRI
jgi:hypothetical protein